MRIKSYYAASVESAMGTAAREMGPDAVLITSRKTGADARELGEYEVVFGCTEEAPSRTSVAEPEPARVHKAVYASELELVRREVESMRRALSAVWRSSASSGLPEIASADAILQEAHFAPELTEEILTAVEGRLREEALYNQAHSAATPGRRGSSQPGSRASDSRVASMIKEYLESRLRIAPVLGTKSSGRSIVAVVGPTGAGKTTTIVKLAIRYGLTARKPSLILSTDSYRVGATEQLRMYAAAMGIPFQMVDQPAAIRQVLEESRGKELILIDTPGFAPAEMDVAADLAHVFSQIPDLDVHLALPATMHSGSLAKVVSRYERFEPKKAILTKVDEADGLGSALSHAVLANLKPSFITNGQQIPDDIQPASTEYLLSFLSNLTMNVSATAA